MIPFGNPYQNASILSDGDERKMPASAFYGGLHIDRSRVLLPVGYFCRRTPIDAIGTLGVHTKRAETTAPEYGRVCAQRTGRDGTK